MLRRSGAVCGCALLVWGLARGVRSGASARAERLDRPAAQRPAASQSPDSALRGRPRPHACGYEAGTVARRTSPPTQRGHGAVHVREPRSVNACRARPSGVHGPTAFGVCTLTAHGVDAVVHRKADDEWTVHGQGRDEPRQAAAREKCQPEPEERDADRASIRRRPSSCITSTITVRSVNARIHHLWLSVGT
jgi:hypothetical protein